MASRDYEEFIAASNDHGARYLVIRAHAVAFHVRPRTTKVRPQHPSLPADAPEVAAPRQGRGAIVLDTDSGPGVALGSFDGSPVFLGRVDG